MNPENHRVERAKEENATTEQSPEIFKLTVDCFEILFDFLLLFF